LLTTAVEQAHYASSAIETERGMKMADIFNIRQLTLDARAIDKFPNRGKLAVAVDTDGRCQVQRISYDAKGKATINERSEWVPAELLACNLNAESQFGVL
jgi:hypothetical protein